MSEVLSSPNPVTAIDYGRMPRIGDICTYHAQRSPAKDALVFEGRKTDWKTLDLRTNRIANALLADGKPGDRVGYVGKGSDTFFELMFGVAKAGMVLVPVQWRLAEREIESILADAEIGHLFLSGDQFGSAGQFCDLPTVRHCLAMEPGGDLPTFEDWLAAASDLPPPVEVLPTNVAWQIYTSGTTGLPKGVMLSHRNILDGRRHGMEFDMEWFQWRDDDVNLVALPVGHVGGVGWAIVGFFSGATTVIHREFVPADVLRSLTEDGVTRAFFVPAAIQLLLSVPGVREMEFPRLRDILYGASPIALDLLREATSVFECGFCQQYGMTETCGTIVYLPPEDHDPEGNARMRAAGKPMPGVDIRIVHPRDRTVLPSGEVGEVETRSVANLTGYWRREAEFAEAMSADGWLRTGDAGYLDEDGYLFIQDRFKDMICSGAENIFPAEVENAIYGHPAVLEVAVVGVPDSRWGEVAKAIVILKAGEQSSAEDIIAYAADRIARFKLPKTVDFITALPRNPSGKILRRELRDPYWVGQERKVN